MDKEEPLFLVPGGEDKSGKHQTGQDNLHPEKK